MWPRFDSFHGHTKMSFVNIVPQVAIRDTCGTWHSLSTVTSIQSIQRSTRNSPLETRKQVNQWMGEDWRVKTEINRADKWKSLKKNKKEKMFRLRRWLLLHVKQYKNRCLRIFVIRKCIAVLTFCWSLIILWSSYVYVPTDLTSTNKLISTNQWGNEI